MSDCRIYFFVSFWLLINLCQTKTLFAQNFEKISNKEGFNQNTINAIAQDKYGYLWIGTPNGLIKYDGYDFETFTTQFPKSGSIKNNYIFSLFCDDKGIVWIGSRTGLNFYVPWLEKFFLVPMNEPILINKIQADEKGNIWFSSTSKIGRCKITDVNSMSLEYYEDIFQSPDLNQPISDFSFIDDNTLIYSTSNGLFKYEISANISQIQDNNQEIFAFQEFENVDVRVILKSDNFYWIGSNNGTYKITIDGKHIHVLNKLEDFLPKSAESIGIVNELFEDKDGQLWVGTVNDGMFKFNQKNNEVLHFQHDPKNLSGLSSKRINAIYQDNFDIIWIGTAQGGLNKLDISQKPFYSFVHNPYDPTSISDNLIMSIVKDKSGFLWISGFNVPLYRSIDPVRESDLGALEFQDMTHLLPNTTIMIRSFYQDSKGWIWIGTNRNVLVYDPENQMIKTVHLNHEDENLNTNLTFSIAENEEENQIILAGRALIVIDNPWEQIRSNQEPNLEVASVFRLDNKRINAMHIDENKRFWLGTNRGLYYGSLENNTFLLIENETSEISSDFKELDRSDIFCLHKQGDYLWIGTFTGGLYKLKLDSDNRPTEIEAFRENETLPDDAIYGILEENDSTLWLSTDMGLVKFNTNSNSVNVFDVRDGLAHNNFRQNAFFKDEKNLFYFGGLNGLTIFDPNQIQVNQIPPEVLISDIFINNRVVNIGDKINGRVLLNKNIAESELIRISRKNRIISFDLASLHTSTPTKNKLAYKLEGFNEEWIELPEGKSKVTYTNLSANNYKFKVRASNGDGIWSQEPYTLGLKILPFWYNTWWSYSFLAILLITLCFGIIRYFVQLERLKQGLIYEKKDKERIETINRSKLQFFTNLSHEFRTPLTLISGPLEKIIENNSDPSQERYLSIIQKNTKRLLNLADQLITFRKVEQGHIDYHFTKLTLGELIYPTTDAFENYALEKNINFFYKISHPNAEIIADIEKIERILFNLLSNAFKNTSPQDNISIEATILENGPTHNIQIDVIDTGKGIPQDNIHNIFERFYQVENHMYENKSGGIGLSFSKSLITVLGGEISVTSNPGIETRFTIIFPSKIEEDVESETIKNNNYSFIKDWIPYVHQDMEFANDEIHNGNKKKLQLLIVEDEQDVRDFLCNEFSKSYQVIVASNGKEALEKVKNHDFQLIICDVMMPEMNGFELCEQIKKDNHTYHIPVILLTALGDSDNLIKGLEFGADEYISKPFSVKHLQLRASGLIQNALRIKEHFSKNSQLPTEDLELNLSKRDVEFIEQINAIILANLENSSFGVEELSKEVGLSTSHFYRKLKQLTGQVPNAFIRNFRLNKAAELMQSNEGYNVAEVMYQIGIESKSYFSTSFKKLFGVSPSEYIKKYSNENIHH